MTTESLNGDYSVVVVFKKNGRNGLISTAFTPSASVFEIYTV